MELETTNPTVGDDTGLPTVADNAGVGADASNEPEQLFDDDGNPIEAPPEDEEIELDEGIKLKVSKDHAQRVREAMLRQADYTRKTQEVAELRKAVEADRSNLHNLSQGELDAYARATALNDQIAGYANVNWQGLMNQAAANYDTEEQARIQAEFMRYTQLKDGLQAALGNLQNVRNQRQSIAQQETAKRIDQGRQTLTKEIPGWNDDHKAKLIGFAAEYGFTADELSDLEADPRVAKVLHAAFEGRDAKRKSDAAQKHLTAQTVQPAAKVGGSTAIAPNKLDDRLSADEWIRRRNAQLKKQGG